MGPKAIILFDGVCNLCSATVQFIIKRDKKNYFNFASLQSLEGQKLLAQHGLPLKDLNSLLLIENGKTYSKSTGVLRALRRLNSGWPLTYIFIIVPQFLRDNLYNWVAKNRYKWFGKKESCMLSSPELRARFLS